jgi:hypothetical protein
VFALRLRRISTDWRVHQSYPRIRRRLIGILSSRPSRSSVFPVPAEIHAATQANSHPNFGSGDGYGFWVKHGHFGECRRNRRLGRQTGQSGHHFRVKVFIRPSALIRLAFRSLLYASRRRSCANPAAWQNPARTRCAWTITLSPTVCRFLPNPGNLAILRPGHARM